MNTLIGSLVAIAALDSLNPTAVALQIYLLSTPKPVVRSIAFILGVFLAYWTAGFVIILGLGQLLTTVLSNLNFTKFEPYLYGLQLLLGMVLLIVGFTLKISTQPNEKKRPQKLTADRTFLLGLAVTIWEFPTALPYLAAIEQISRAKLDPLAVMRVLGMYNSIFVLPLIILLGIYLIFHRQSTELLQRINRTIAIWSPRILRALLMGLGLLLVFDSLAYSIGRSFLKFAQISN
jgi:cytochrome c biogenesis protein CcdA